MIFDMNVVRNRLYNFLIRVQDDDPARRVMSEAAIILLWVIFGGNLVLLLAGIAVSHYADLRSMILAACWLLPSYVLIRRGRMLLGVFWLTVGISSFALIIATLDVTHHDDFRYYFDYILPLLFTPLLAAMLIRPRMALTATLANCIVIAVLFWLWEADQHDMSAATDAITSLIIPVVIQVVLGATCTLLADRLQRTARHSSEQAMLLKGILEAMPVGVAIFDNADHPLPVYYNPRFATFTGAATFETLRQVRREPYLIRTPDNLSAPMIPASEWPWQTAWREGTYREFNAMIKHPGDNDYELHEETSAIRDKNNRVLYILYVATDIRTEQTLNRQINRLFQETEVQLNTDNMRLTELDRLKGEFLANVSHELRTPLSIILAHTELMALNPPPEVLANRSIEEISTAALTLRAMVNDLLDAARLDSGQLTINRQRLDLRLPLRQAAQSIEVLARRKKLRLDVYLPDQPVWVSGENRRLQQIALNLLSNAVKFTERGQITLCLSIGADPPGGVPTAYFYVEDSGIGIDPALQTYLFHRFVQGPTTGRKRRGTGLGLNVARNLARLHDGEVWLESSTPGRGSRFTCRLPLATGPDNADSATITTPL